MDKFDIYFVVGGKDYAFRSWIAVPRLGERVMFHLKEGPKTFKVVDVLWGVAPDDKARFCTVNVKLEPEDPTPLTGVGRAALEMEE